MPSIFYLGPEGTFSHILARKRFGTRSTLVPCASIEGVFDAVRSQPSALGLVPVENSSGGTVYDSIDLLIRHAGHVYVHEELALDVRIALLARESSGISTIYSHFIQLKHHADWLKARFPRARLRSVSSTAVAAARAASARHAAALASPGAGPIYGLKVIEQPRSVTEVNVTHFYTIGSTPAPSASHLAKTAFIAALPNVCGSLHSFLGPFARQKVSLARIVSRPVRGKPQTYVFFIEIEGHADDAPVRSALARAGRLAESLVSLGTFSVRGWYKS